MKDQKVIFLYGNDEFAISRRLAELGSMFSDAAGADMNTARLEARTMNEDDLNNAVNALPFLAKQRLVLLANPSARYTTPQLRQKFTEFLGKVPDTARLVMYENVPVKSGGDPAQREREDERHWLVKWMKKAGLGLERHALPSQREMTGWIIKHVKERGGQIDQPGAAKLAEMVGSDTRQAAQEVTKLLTYVNWSRPIAQADVEAISTLTAEPDIFAMVDALAAGNGTVAQRMLHRLLEEQDAFGIWGMIVRQFRLLLVAREVIDRRGTEADVAQALGVQPFVARKAFGQARRFSLPVLEKIYHRLLEIDEAAKTGRMPIDVSMEILVAELTT